MPEELPLPDEEEELPEDELDEDELLDEEELPPEELPPPEDEPPLLDEPPDEPPPEQALSNRLAATSTGQALRASKSFPTTPPYVRAVFLHAGAPSWAPAASAGYYERQICGNHLSGRLVALPPLTVALDLQFQVTLPWVLVPKAE